MTAEAEIPVAAVGSRAEPGGGTGRAEYLETSVAGTKAEPALLEAVLDRSNMHRAYDRVVRNKGAAGVDGLGATELGDLLRQHWPTIKAKRPATVRTDENTLELLRRLAQFYSDAMIASILNRQGKTTAYGHPFNADRVGNLRRHWDIPCFDPNTAPTDGELVNVRQAAKILGVATSTVHRWLNDGFIEGEQTTPGAPWRIRITDAFRPRLMEKTPPGYVSMFQAMQKLGVTRQAVLQRVKRGELDAIHIRAGRKKALRIKVEEDQLGLFGDSA